MFDLMYVNRQYQRQYAFLRAVGKELMLVVANFDEAPVTMQLSIPDHAYSYLDMQEKAYEAVDLLTDEHRPMVLIKGESVEVKLDGYQSVVYKLNA
jgi:hypothetical protein